MSDRHITNEEREIIVRRAVAERDAMLAGQSEEVADQLVEQLQGIYGVSLLGNVDRLRMLSRHLFFGTASKPSEPAQDEALKVAREALRVFIGCAVPVSTAIHARGHSWCESYLDNALPIATAALAQIDALSKPDSGGSCSLPQSGGEVDGSS